MSGLKRRGNYHTHRLSNPGISSIGEKGLICYLGNMDNSSGISKMAGRVGSLLVALGVAAFFIGIFGGPRSFAFVGLAMMAAALVGFFVEEQINRRAYT